MSLVIHYTFGKINQSTLIDEQGLFDLTINGAAMTDQGRIDKALYFNPAISSHCTGTGDLSAYSRGTIAFWFKLPEGYNPGVGYQAVWGYMPSTGSDRIYSRFHTTTGRFTFVSEVGGENYFINSDSGSWTANTWYHCAITNDGATSKMFIGAVEQIDTSAGTKWFNDYGGSDVSLYLGCLYVSGLVNFANVLIDDFRIYDSVLSLSEIQALAAMEGGTDEPYEPPGWPEPSDLYERIVSRYKVIGTLDRSYVETDLLPYARVELNGLLAGHFDIPFAEDYSIFIDLLLDLAFYREIRTRDPEKAEKTRDDILGRITRITQGKEKIWTGTEHISPVSPQVWSTTIDYDPTHTMRGSLRDTIDPDRLSDGF